MPLLKVSAPLRPYTANRAEISLSGSTVAEAVEDLLAQFPAMRPHLFDAKGELRRFINIFVNDLEIRGLSGLQTPLLESDRLLLLPSISGG